VVEPGDQPTTGPGLNHLPTSATGWLWYDGAMSESNSESDGSGSDGSGSAGSGEGIGDDQLPDDLNPDKNPLADPEGKGAGADEGSSGDSGDDSSSAEGMPDMGQPG
jgi:hypothetical protein